MAIRSALRRCVHALGYEVHRIPPPMPVPETVVPPFDRIHYGCGYNYLPGWLNADIIRKGPPGYLRINLVARHPFPDNFFQFGFSEDFLEHIDQASSLIFLVEVHRTLRKGGVLRLSFPVLDSVVTKHFASIDYESFEEGKRDAFDALGHIHFYSRDSLALVARHMGFRVELVEAGKSRHADLHGIDTRMADVNVHVELTKL